MTTRRPPGVSPEARYQPGLTAGDVGRDTVPTRDPAPGERQPKGDHNRRLALFLEPAQFAAEAGITEEELREYERTPPDGRFDREVARRVGDALERLESVTPASRKVIS